MVLAKYQIIRNWLEQKISSGEWPELGIIPTELEIADKFDASRMTARRAIMELVEKQKLIRRPGLGTYVAEQRPTSSLLKIKNIADEVAERGHKYSSQLIELKEQPADFDAASELGLAVESAIFVSELLHFENDQPIQLEKRYINKNIAPDYLSQSFDHSHTPASFLQSNYPLTKVLFFVESRIASKYEQQHLGLESNEAVLIIKRKTWCKEGIVSYAELIHPGSKYQLGGELNFSDVI